MQESWEMSLFWIIWTLRMERGNVYHAAPASVKLRKGNASDYCLTVFSCKFRFVLQVKWSFVLHSLFRKDERRACRPGQHLSLQIHPFAGYSLASKRFIYIFSQYILIDDGAVTIHNLISLSKSIFCLVCEIKKGLGSVKTAQSQFKKEERRALEEQL